MSKGLSGRLSALVVAMLVGTAVFPAQAADEFRVRPYLQNPTSKEVTVRWLSESGWERRAYDDSVTFTTVPEPGTGLLVLSGIAAGLFVRRCRRRACMGRTCD